MSLRAALRRAYFRIGIHAAPRGTLLFYVNSAVRSLFFVGQLRHASRDVMRRSPYGGTPYYDIAWARRNRQVDGLALIFFMGLGDYLMATPMIEALRLAHPDLPIYAYASSSSDPTNSPLLIHLLRANPMIDQVFSYRGYPGPRWIDYDFRDALRSIPKNFLILPVVYETVLDILHRETSLFETFGLPVRLPVRGPLLYTAVKLTEPAAILQAAIARRIEKTSAQQIVCCHLGARSSGYDYPEVEQLLRGLLAENCLVIHFGSSEIADENLIEVDVATITPNDTVVLLHALKNDAPSLCLVSVNSFMWPISAGLGLRNLGLHIFYDETIHQYLYPNIFVVTQHKYLRVSPSRMFLAPPGSFRESLSKSNISLTNFDATFVINCFRQFLEIN
jgi:hypothetical protein